MEAFLESVLSKVLETQWVLLDFFFQCYCLLTVLLPKFALTKEKRNKTEAGTGEGVGVFTTQPIFYFLSKWLYVYWAAWGSVQGLLDQWWINQIKRHDPFAFWECCKPPTTLPNFCLSLCSPSKQFFLHNLASPSYLSSFFLANARMSCLKFLFRPLLVYGIVQIPYCVCSNFALDTIGFCGALGFKRQ